MVERSSDGAASRGAASLVVWDAQRSETRPRDVERRRAARYPRRVALPTVLVCGHVTLHDLGGTDPYGSGLYEPLPYTGATSPIF